MIKVKEQKWSNLIFIIVIGLFIFPTTRKYISVNLNKLVVAFSPFEPSVIAAEEQVQLEPFEYKLESIEGSRLNTTVGKGKVTFINYWATWCPPCIAELPSIERLYADYGNKITFLLITNENPSTVKKFIERKNYNIPAVIPTMNTPEKLYERSIPTTYIIDKKGKIVMKEQGAVDWNSAEVRQLLSQLLQED